MGISAPGAFALQRPSPEASPLAEIFISSARDRG